MRPTYEYILQPTPTRRVSFGRTELLNIGMAMGALTLVFVIVWFNPLFGPVRIDAGEIGLIVVSSFIAVLTGFLMHEIAHKVVAVRYGLWAEFRADRRGLLFAVLTALFGFVIAAPGAVMIAGPVSLRQNGRISAAGPLTNLSFGGTFSALLFTVAFLHIEIPWFLRFLFIQITLVNLILGTFNMIPVPPLDGSKIWWWKKPVWAGMFAVFVVLLAAFFIYF